MPRSEKGASQPQGDRRGPVGSASWSGRRGGEGGGALAGKTVVATAGPTREYLDPVRFLSNASTGMMGFAIADAARRAGAKTILIAGPTYLRPPGGVAVIRVMTALEMWHAVTSVYEKADVVISAAAVADFRPKIVQKQKIKKSPGSPDERLVIELVKTRDILTELGEKKGERVLVGFAAETEKLVENARDKLRRKNLDLIVANDVTRKNSGFGSPTNEVTLISRRGEPVRLSRLTKVEVAERVLEEVTRILGEREAERQESR